MTAQLRVGIVGAGQVGGLGDGLGSEENSHAGGYSRIEECELVSIADIDSERLEQFGKQWGIPPEHRYSKASEMYARENLDVISVTTPPMYHHHPVIEAADAGVKVILVEKPLAISVEWGRKMVEACELAGSRLITGHTRRFLPPFKKIKKMIDEGLIGEVRTIETSGSRPLLANGTHTVDYAFYWTDAEPRRVSGFLSHEPSPGPPPPGFTGYWTYENYLDSKTPESPGPPLADPGGAGMIVCDGGIVIFVNCIATRWQQESATMIAGTEGRIRYVESTGIWQYGPLLKRSAKNRGTHYDWEDIPDMPKEVDQRDYFYGSVLEAVTCHLEDRESVSTGRDGLKTLEVLTAIHISHKTGAMVRLPLVEGLDQHEIRSSEQ